MNAEGVEPLIVRPVFQAECLLRLQSRAHADPCGSSAETICTTARLIEEFLDYDLCPRCGGRNDGVVDSETVIGSMETVCRCIPICSFCAQAESLSLCVGKMTTGDNNLIMAMHVFVDEWPIDRHRQMRALVEWQGRHPGQSSRVARAASQLNGIDTGHPHGIPRLGTSQLRGV